MIRWLKVCGMNKDYRSQKHSQTIHSMMIFVFHLLLQIFTVLEHRQTWPESMKVEDLKERSWNNHACLTPNLTINVQRWVQNQRNEQRVPDVLWPNANNARIIALASCARSLSPHRLYISAMQWRPTACPRMLICYRSQVKKEDAVQFTASFQISTSWPCGQRPCCHLGAADSSHSQRRDALVGRKRRARAPGFQWSRWPSLYIHTI